MPGTLAATRRDHWLEMTGRQDRPPRRCFEMVVHDSVGSAWTHRGQGGIFCVKAHFREDASSSRTPPRPQ
eukprot:6241849-Prymnesium_polylepis.1